MTKQQQEPKLSNDGKHMPRPDLTAAALAAVESALATPMDHTVDAPDTNGAPLPADERIQEAVKDCGARVQSLYVPAREWIAAIRVELDKHEAAINDGEHKALEMFERIADHNERTCDHARIISASLAKLAEAVPTAKAA